jgi:hypothetical protein
MPHAPVGAKKGIINADARTNLEEHNPQLRLQGSRKIKLRKRFREEKM